MGYIYKITNKVNGKVYIGQTCRSIETRWKEHIKLRKYHPNTPLYKAMNEYGISNFIVEEVEQCPDNKLGDREKFWIKECDSFGLNGYNATLGGNSGAIWIDRQKVIDTYAKIGTVKGTARELGHDPKTIRGILRAANIEIPETSDAYIRKTQGKPVAQYDLQDNYIQTFDCLRDAERYLEKPKGGYHISEVCKGKRGTAYGYKWKYADEIE